MKEMIFFAIFILMSTAYCAALFDADFQRDFHLFQAYREVAPQLDDNKHLFMETGTQINISIPNPGRYKITAKVNGESEVQMAIFGGKANTYSQKKIGGGEISLSYFGREQNLRMCLYTLNAKAFVLESLTVDREVPPALEDRDVDLVAYEAEDFPGHNGWSRRDSNSLSGTYRAGRRWYYPLSSVPVPLTSKPLFLYMRARRQGQETMSIDLKAGVQTMARAEIHSTAFEWVQLGPLDAHELAPAVSLQIGGPPNIDVDIDRIVWSTKSDLPADRLNASAGENPKSALVSAFPVKEPEIDGILDDPAWQSAISITPFRMNTANEFAAEQTSVKLGYDAENLYVGFHAWESALDPVNQRMHEFINELQKPDIKKCYNDDVVLLLIQREGNPVMFEFVVNAAGIATAATSTGPNFWGTREAIELSNVRAAGTIGNGFFCVEMAIPFAALGGPPNGNNDFRILPGRLAKSRNESSSFSAVKVGFHLAENLIPLHFAKRPFGLELSKIPAFNSGNNNVEVRGDKILFLNVLESDGKRDNFVSEDGFFKIAQSGDFIFSCGIYDPATLAPLLKMPPFHGRTRSTQLEFQQIPGVEVKVNARHMASGMPLSSGANRITVSGNNADKMTFRVGPNEIAVDSTWKKEKNEYEKILLLEHSLLWPDWTKEGVSVMSGQLQQILFPPLPPKDLRASDLEFHVELPEGFIFEGASGYYKLYPLTVSETAGILRDGEKYNRFTIRFQKEIAWNAKFPSHTYVAFAFRAPETETGMETKFFFHASSTELAASEIPNECKIIVLPVATSKTPEKVHVQLWTGWLRNLDDSTLKEKILAGIKNSGYNEVSVKNNQGITYFTLIDFESWNLSTLPFLELEPGSELVHFQTGKPDKSYTCPLVMQKEPFGKWFEKALPEWLERREHPEIVCWDFEGGIFKSYLACVCPGCLEQFSKIYNLPGPLTPAEIETKYSKQWCSFMTSQMAGVARLMYTTLKRISPQTLFYIYSGYESEQTKFQYGVDWNKVAPYMDFGGAGYGRAKSAIAATVEACSPKPAIMGVIVYPYDVSSRIFPGVSTRAELMRSLIDSSGGILIYNYPTLDGRSFSAQADVSRIVAENESFFAPGQYRDAANEAKGSGCEYFVRADNKGNFILVFTNESLSKVHCEAVFRQTGLLVDCLTGKTVDSMQVEIPAGGIAVYRLETDGQQK